MTDGIIQEVFKQIAIDYSKYINEHHCAGILMRTQTELIEKIKQLREQHDKCHECPCSYADELIGDNE